MLYSMSSVQSQLVFFVRSLCNAFDVKMNIATLPSSSPARPGSAPLQQQNKAYASSLNSAERGRQNHIMLNSGVRNRHASVNRSASSTRSFTPQLPDLGMTRSVAGSRATSNPNTSAQSAWRRWIPNYFLKKEDKTSEELETIEAYAKVIYKKDEDNIETIPAIARFMNHSQSFRMHRKFGPIRETLLLRRGIELTRLWKEWKLFHAANQNDEWSTEQYREEEEKIRAVQLKLEEYEKLQESCVRMESLAPVSDKDFQSVRTYVVENQSKVDQETGDYLLHKYDMVTTTRGSANDKQKSWVAEKIESCVKGSSAWSRLPRFIFQTSNEDGEFENKLLWHGKKSRIALVSKFIFAFVVATVMLIPTLSILLFDWEPKVRASLIAVAFVFGVVVLGIIVDLDERELFLCIAALGAIFLAVLGNTFDRGNPGS
ncbi:hypothetical protein BJ875DRAFT_479966 [Amylocarpus encephaloides]|uniref:DUF6594 domain-containing protein n=1 Tax=Amylocarpus encephaloides TaxID=45428 RepID=A0A9P7YS31_9HELO|nr:hypothetical protein BJ875DRAFT_479966 [Amylocarpus encephaloides]